MQLRVIDAVEVGVERRTIAVVVGRGSGGAGVDFVSDSSPGLHLTYGFPGFLTLPPGGDWLFVALRMADVNRLLSASMTLHSAEVCEYWVLWQ